jgi:uncharacterized protein
LRPVLLDTGVIVALLDRSEQHHAKCVEAVQNLSAPLVTCEAVIAESCYLLREIHGAAEAVLENVATGTFQVRLQISQCARSVQKLIRKYRDRRADFADTCLIQLATDLRTGEILTLDSDFRVYRWGGNKPFRLLPRL